MQAIQIEAVVSVDFDVAHRRQPDCSCPAKARTTRAEIRRSMAGRGGFGKVRRQLGPGVVVLQERRDQRSMAARPECGARYAGQTYLAQIEIRQLNQDADRTARQLIA